MSRSWGQTRPKVPYQKHPNAWTENFQHRGVSMLESAPFRSLRYHTQRWGSQSRSRPSGLIWNRPGLDSTKRARGEDRRMSDRTKISNQEQGKSRTKESYLQTIASDLHSVRESSPMPRRVGWSGVEPKAVLPMFENGGRTPSKKALALRSASSAAASAGVSCASTQTSVSVVSSPLCDGFAREQNAGLPCSHRARC